MRDGSLVRNQQSPRTNGRLAAAQTFRQAWAEQYSQKVEEKSAWYQSQTQQQ